MAQTFLSRSGLSAERLALGSDPGIELGTETLAPATVSLDLALGNRARN
jgi:hypothetical protein